MLQSLSLMGEWAVEMGVNFRIDLCSLSLERVCIGKSSWEIDWIANKADIILLWTERKCSSG